MIPTTKEAQRIGTLFNRKPTTPWSEREIRQFKKLKKAGCFDNLDDLRLIECYYVFERGKEKGIHRRDVYTFLNNWPGELDRARAWAEEQNEKKKRKSGIKKAEDRDEQAPVNDEDFKRAGELAKVAVARLREQLGRAVAA